ncbi:MAG TPA: acyl-CoA dehydrogenase family protein [Stellaceae bacterium]|nr:acyl-CoA dehydrogenase family protein [Stellaceae bacterium]
MNFDFSAEVKMMGEEARRFLSDRGAIRSLRRLYDSDEPFDRGLWQAIAEMGWLGAIVPEEHGGSALGYEALCILAGEIGAALPPLPFAATSYFVIDTLVRSGSEAQKSEYLPRLAAGELTGTFALAEGLGNPSPKAIEARVERGRLTGVKQPVVYGAVADLAVVVAVDETDEPGLKLVDLTAGGVERHPIETFDRSRREATLRFNDAPCHPLGEGGWGDVLRALDRAAILLAFEQVGGAQACLDMARDYALERYAFGRPIGSFQAIKHKLADVYVALELARAHCYYGAWALETGSAELPVAAAAARVAASEAYHQASKENIQTHGGMGITWELDCHFYYRRAKSLSLELGSPGFWKDRLIGAIEAARE